MVIKPNLLIPVHSIISPSQLFLWQQFLNQRTVLLHLLDLYVSFLVFLVDEHVCILAGRTAAPLVGHPAAAVTLLFEEGHGEGGDSGVIEFDPAVALLDDAVVVAHVWSAGVHDDALEAQLVELLAATVKGLFFKFLCLLLVILQSLHILHSQRFSQLEALLGEWFKV